MGVKRLNSYPEARANSFAKAKEEK